MDVYAYIYTKLGTMMKVKKQASINLKMVSVDIHTMTCILTQPLRQGVTE